MSQFALAQNIISKSSTITFTNAYKIEYIDLEENGNVFTFIDKKSNQEFNYPKNTVFKIVDEKFKEMNVANLSTFQNIPKKEVKEDGSNKFVEPMIYDGPRNISMHGVLLDKKTIREKMKINTLALKQYNTGKILNSIGTVSLGIGTGFILYRVLVVSDLEDNKNNISSGYPATEYKSDGKPMILTGVALLAVGLTLKLTGAGQVKKSVSTYNSTLATANYFKPEYSIKVNGNGLGLAVSF